MNREQRPFNHELKLDRAFQHLQSLETEVQRWLGSHPYAFVEEFYAQRSENVLRVVALEPPPAMFGVIIGDCVHNLRSALDNLVYDLAISYIGFAPLPEDLAKRLEFPIFGNRAMKPGEHRTKIGCINPRAQTVIKRLQPCRRGDDFVYHPLWKLRELSNFDKHRLVHLAMLDQRENVFGAAWGRNTSIEHLTFPGAEIIEPLSKEPIEGIEDGAEVARYRAVPIDPSKKMHVYFHLIFGVAFGHGSPAYGESVLGTLRLLHAYILNEVIPPLKPFL